MSLLREKPKKQAKKASRNEKVHRGLNGLLGQLANEMFASNNQESQALKKNLKIQLENAQRWQALSEQCIDDGRFKEAEVLQDKANKALAAYQRGELVFDDY